MPIRNPFARRLGATVTSDDNAGPDGMVVDIAHPGFERVDTVGSKASSALSIRSRKSQDTGEYKMSVVNDSGVYLPPSPTEREATWPRRYLSRASSDTKSSMSGEIEHFSISRESFDSYRRSFDICAKSPVVGATTDPAPQRQSLDSANARFPRLPRSALYERRFEREPPTPEEGFEDVGLNDDNKQQQRHAAPPKKRGFFSKFGQSDPAIPANTNQDVPSPTTSGGGGIIGVGGNLQTMTSRFLPGRKRGQSIGQGAELGAMPVTAADNRPTSAVSSLQEQEVQS
ncbi:hypothetical protein B0H66DRAFT_545030 [Apodospora peruviana]|uniref:Uncharacterized protein n=1 Tax=Apodospora peruviana TaxID=516989 RepID=A0AAE0MG04_9PEZI|nr:hypothetical protein B0H66DRAFT_545030 [Apodospora peruviana]